MSYSRVFAPYAEGASVLKEIITFAADSEGTFSELFAVAFPSLGRMRTDVVAFTSAHKGAGVSFVAASVAERLAASTNGRILFISATAIEVLRKCTLDVIQTALRAHDLGNLSVLATGRGIPQVERFDSAVYERSLPETIDLLRSQYRSVVIDVPAVMGSDLAVRYAPAVDSVVLVVQAGKTKRNEIAISSRRIQSAKGRIAGLVCNRRQYQIPHWLYPFLC